MSEDSGDGGFTGNADGAPYSGYDPGPASSDESTPAPAPHEIYDPPIEHDPIGQALVGLPFGIVTGVGTAIAEGGSIVAEVGSEVVAWGVAELGLAGADAVMEGSSDQGSSGAEGAGPTGASDAGAEGGVGAYDSEQ